MAFLSPTICTGTGRSGTSLIAGMLYHLGVHMGDTLIKGNKTNPTGHYEDKEFRDLHLAFIADKINEDQFKANAISKVRTKGTQGRVWGWKIPSTSNVIGYYLDWFPNSRVIWCKRDMEDAVKSCMKAYGWDEEKSRNLLEERWENLEEHVDSKRDWLQLDYERMLKAPAETVDKIIDYCDLRPSDRQRETAIDLVFDPKKTEDAGVLITVPTLRREIAVGLSALLHRMDNDERYKVDVQFPSWQPIANARNRIVNDLFLPEEKYDFLVMIDDDNPPTQNMLDLVKLNKDAICLPTPTFQKGRVFYNIMDSVPGATRDLPTFKPVPPGRQEGLRRIDAAGTGCFMVHRRVYEELEPPYFKDIFDEDGQKIRGEDFYFTMKAKEAGFKFWTHWDYKCHHYKKLDLLKLVKMAEKLSK